MATGGLTVVRCIAQRPSSDRCPRIYPRRTSQGVASGRDVRRHTEVTLCASTRHGGPNCLLSQYSSTRGRVCFGSSLGPSSVQQARADRHLMAHYRRPSSSADHAAENEPEPEEEVDEGAPLTLYERGVTEFDGVDLVGRKVHPRVQELVVESKSWPEQKSDEWWASRQRMLTASDASAVLGESPFATPEKVFEQKMGRVQFARPNAAMKHGNKTETEALRVYESQTGQTCLRFGLKAHDRYDWLGASPDGITLSGRLVEIKCPYNRKKSHQGLKKRYMAQCQILMEVFDLEVCDLVQYFKPTRGKRRHTGGSLSCTEIKRDREWFQSHFGELQEFVNKLHAAQSAAAAASDAAAETPASAPSA